MTPSSPLSSRRQNRVIWHPLPSLLAILVSLASLVPSVVLGTGVPLEGFVPMVGMALTNEFQDSRNPAFSTTFFLAQKRNQTGGQFLGQGTNTYFDIALLDTGAATHILTQAATTGFNIDGRGFAGTNFQTIGGATGLIDLRINDPLGVYISGMANRTATQPALTMNTTTLRGQTSFSTLSAPAEWKLPNIIGLPMAAQHQIHIVNSQPQIFDLNGRTVRTPNVVLRDLGSGNQGITRRSPMRLEPGAGFIQGPIYIQNFDLTNLTFHDNPLSPTIVQNGSLVIETDLTHRGNSLQDRKLLFDTGASLSVVSEQTAVRLGFDPILDTPDFVIAVEGSGGVTSGIPGFFLDQLRLDTVGGSFALNRVPIAVLDVTNPSDPGNVIDGILGMNVFMGRDLVIDANPSIGQGGVGPSLYISDPVTTSRAWGTTATSGNWVTSSSWSAPGVPAPLWDVTVANIRGSAQEALVNSNSTVFRASVSGTPSAPMAVRVTTGATLTVFADMTLSPGGQLQLDGGRVDAQYVDVAGGSITGRGTIFVGSGPISGTVSVTEGSMAPGTAGANPIGLIGITGDVAFGLDGTLAIDLGGRVAGVSYDQVTASRFAFLSGSLSVSLVNLGGGTFAPQVGDVFQILTATDGVQGAFDSLALPSGYTWSVQYLATSVRLSVTGLGLLGDFNGDGLLNCTDVNLLSEAAAGGTGGSNLDLNGDGSVNQLDVQQWVTNIKGTLMGDANLDGVVDGSDFGVWNSSKFTANAQWCSGDFNTDGVVDGSDFGVWNANKFQSASAFVPEPAAIAWLAMVVLLWGRRATSLNWRGARKVGPARRMASN